MTDVKRTLKLRRMKSGGQYDGVVSIGETWYVEIFSSLENAKDFAARHDLKLIEPTEEPDELPQGPSQVGGGGQPQTRH